MFPIKDNSIFLWLIFSPNAFADLKKWVIISVNGDGCVPQRLCRQQKWVRVPEHLWSFLQTN